ncbi:MAG: undecaprenyl-phosphate glucose phosphotransferase [Candidatus Hydrothermales bacterium]
MGLKGHPSEKFILILLDVISLFLGFKTAYWFRFESSIIPLWRQSVPYEIYFKSFLVVFILGLLLYLSKGIYEKEKNLTTFDSFFELIKINFLYLLFVTLISFYYRQIVYSRLTVLFYFIFVTFYQFIFRILYRNFFKILFKRGIWKKEAIVIGEGDILRALRSRIEERPDLGLNISRVYTVNEFFENSIESKDDTILILALPFEKQILIPQIIRKFEGKKLEIYFAPDIYELMLMGAETFYLNGIPLLKLKEKGLAPFQSFVKRSFDIIFSLLFLIIFSPLFILSAILIKLTSKGPVFYKQDRVGKDGKIFKLYKFRTMYEGADKEKEPKFTTPSDPRVTKVGRILRKFSIDEFPQFINVLKGEMSIVGPRPERPYFVEKFKKEIPRYDERHRVKGGITGWAQVHGWRGDTSIEERLRYDLYYIDNYSFLLDLKIILKTVAIFFSQKNAY